MSIVEHIIAIEDLIAIEHIIAIGRIIAIRAYYYLHTLDRTAIEPIAIENSAACPKSAISR